MIIYWKLFRSLCFLCHVRQAEARIATINIPCLCRLVRQPVEPLNRSHYIRIQH